VVIGLKDDAANDLEVDVVTGRADDAANSHRDD